MRTTCLICLLLLGIWKPAFSQNGKWKNAYEHYRGFYSTGNSMDFWYDFDGTFDREEIGLSMHLERNVYLIKMRIAEKIRDSIVWREKKYDGFYTISDGGELCLMNQHPFSSDCFWIKEKMVRKRGKKYIEYLYFTPRFNTEFTRFSSKKQIVHRDDYYSPPNEQGESSITYKYFPDFFPNDHVVLPEQRDSIGRILLTGGGYVDSASIKAYLQTKIPDHVALALHIDSMRFDTVYVSNGVYYLERYQSRYGGSHHTEFRLSKVLKLNYRSFRVWLQEGSELFATPSFSAPVNYVREEIDVLSDLKITDFRVDRYGIYWVHIELDKWDQHSDTHTYPSGWVMQNLLFNF